MKFFSKKTTVFLLIFALFLGLFLVNINGAKANVLGEIGKDILQAMASFALKVAQLFTGLMGKLFTWILNYGSQGFYQAIVYTGWTITRDIVNMFFILGLVVIAFATILRIETYGMKALLMKFIIIAVLINFSYLACGIIIDASQVAANYFIGQIQTSDIGLAILDRLQVSRAITPSQGQTVAITISDPELTTALNTAFSAAIIAVAGFVLLIGAVLLVLRIGALWLLTILAPFAWFCSIFPALQEHSKKWWSEIFKWSFFAPIYVFFIYLVIRISQETMRQVTSPDTLQTAALSEMMSNTNLFFYYVFLVILLLSAPSVAMSLGIKSAGAVTAFARGALKGTVVRGARTALRGSWSKIDREVLAPRGLSFRAAKEGWKMRKAEKEERAYAPAVGKWFDRFNKVFDKKKTFEGERAQDLLIDKERSIIRKQGLGKQELAELTWQALKGKDMARFQAGLLELHSRGDDEGVLQHPELGKKYNYITSPENFQQLLKETIKDEKEAIRLAGKIGAMDKTIGLPQYDGMVVYDEDKQEMTWAEDDKVGETGGYEAMKINPRDRWRRLCRRAFMSQDKNGNPVQVTNTLKVMLKLMDETDINEARNNMPAYNKDYVNKGKDLIQAEINAISGPQRDRTQRWLNGIVASAAGQKEGKEGEESILSSGGEKEFKEAKKTAKEKGEKFG